jgi:hypothetical protein
MLSRILRKGSAAGRSPEATRRANEESQPAALPAPWVTFLTCPTCRTPDAVVAFEGVGTVCRECGEAVPAEYLEDM